jgi:hypothetical protein
LLLDTSTSFIQRLGQHDPNAWDQFTTKYGWMMRRWIENDGDIALLKLTAANDGEKAYVPMRTLANGGDIALLKLTATNDGEKAYVPMRTVDDTPAK